MQFTSKLLTTPSPYLDFALSYMVSFKHRLRTRRLLITLPFSIMNVLPSIHHRPPSHFATERRPADLTLHSYDKFIFVLDDIPETDELSFRRCLFSRTGALSDYNIQKESTLHLRGEHNRLSYLLSFTDVYTIRRSSLRPSPHRQDHHPPDQQRLIFAGTLIDCNTQKEPTLLRLSLRACKPSSRLLSRLIARGRRSLINATRTTKHLHRRSGQYGELRDAMTCPHSRRRYVAWVVCSPSTYVF